MKFNGVWKTKIGIERDYIDFIKNILNNDELFLTFKNEKQYSEIVGCDGMKEQGCDVLSNIIKNKYKFLLKDVKKFQKNDKYGSPILYETSAGLFSPNTLRYMLVLGELEESFGSLNNKNIIEIGGGYGGQCFIISTRHKFKSYTLIDLPEPIELSKKYLNLLKVKNIHFMNTNSIKQKESDLIISNFSLSELSDSGIDFYFNHIISQTNSLYITWNIFDKNRLSNLKNIFNKLFEIKEIPEPKLRKTGTGIWVGKRRT